MGLIPNYVNYDFDEIVAEMQKRLIAKNNTWKDVFASSTGEIIIELYAYIANLNLYYTERRAEECYLDTAKHKSSVVNLVKLLNYIPKRKASATGLLTFTIPSALTGIVNIPAKTSCQTPDGIKFVVGFASEEGEVVGGGVIPVGGLTADVACVQGEIVARQISATGASNQKYLIDDKNVENTILSVRVDTGSGEPVLWEQVSSFLESDPESTHYRIIQELDDRLRVVFGDSVNGKSPELGWVINIEYLRSDGLEGNVYLADQVTEINSDLFYISGINSFLVEDITLTNSSTLIGGDAEQDIEEIRFEAPKVFATGDRAVTGDDFKAILEDMAGVANANVWGENEENPPNYNMFNLVKLAILYNNWVLPNTSQKQTITDSLYEKSMVTVKYEFVEPEIIEIIPVVEVKNALNYSQAEVIVSISASLISNFVLGTTTRIGQLIKYSDLVKDIATLDSVDYLHMYLDIYEDITTWGDLSSDDYAGTLAALGIKKDTVKVYLDDVLIGVDDGDGIFVSSGSTYVITGMIDYTTGITAIASDAPLVGVVSVRYQQDEEGSFVPTNRQIGQLSETGGTYRTEITFIA